jgi:hypothetical protein
VVTNPGGGSSSILRGTAAARPAAAAATGQLYWATDTDEITLSDGAAWHSIQKTSSGQFTTNNGNGFGDSGNDLKLVSGNGNLVGFAATGVRLAGANGVALWNQLAANEAAAATAGAGAAPPATVQGYLKIADSGGATRKVPYYAN